MKTNHKFYKKHRKQSLTFPSKISKIKLCQYRRAFGFNYIKTFIEKEECQLEHINTSIV